MWQERNPSPASPFDCAVCGACVDGKMSGVRTCLPCRSFFRRHAFLPPNVGERTHARTRRPFCFFPRFRRCDAIRTAHVISKRHDAISLLRYRRVERVACRNVSPLEWTWPCYDRVRSARLRRSSSIDISSLIFSKDRPSTKRPCPPR